MWRVSGQVPEIRHLLKGHIIHETESPWPVHFNHSHWWKRRSRSKFASHYAWGTNWVCEGKMDVKSTWIPTYMASNGPCYMVTWIIFKNDLSEVDLHKTGRPWHFERSRPLVYSISSCVRTRMNRNLLKYHLVEGPVTYGFTLHLRIRDHTTWFEGVMGRPLDAFFWALTIS